MEACRTFGRVRLKMEAGPAMGVLDARPPRLEDAGVENCALPADAIQEAFRRAADAVRNASSAAAGVLGRNLGQEPDEECVQNPGPTNGIWEDWCLGSSGEATVGDQESCVKPKSGGLVEEGHDLVVQGGDEIKSDRLVVGAEAGPKLGGDRCVGEDVDEDPPESKEGGPILIESAV